MLKEEDFTEKIIQLINSMPEKEREKISHSIALKKRKTVQRKNSGERSIKELKSNLKKFKKAFGKKQEQGKKTKDSFSEMSKYLDKLGSKLPPDYKFDREEANER